MALGKKGTGLALHRYNTYKTVARLCRSNYLRKTGRSTFMPHSKAKTASYEITSKGFLILKEFHDVIAYYSETMNGYLKTRIKAFKNRKW